MFLGSTCPFWTEEWKVVRWERKAEAIVSDGVVNETVVSGIGENV